jgi:pantoate--beta-alanine ligase
MVTVTTRAELRAELARARSDAAVLGGGRVALVPAMGMLHDGHLRLVDVARHEADIVVMSILPDAPRRSSHEDAACSPRDAQGDAAQARAGGVDLLFVPSVEEFRPRSPRVFVAPQSIAEQREPTMPPDHLAGALTAIAKLFHLVQPDVALFGRMEAQQALLVRAMVEDLDMPIDVCIVPTAGDAEGLGLQRALRVADASQSGDGRSPFVAGNGVP